MRIKIPKSLLELAYRFTDVESSSPSIDDRSLEYAYIISKAAQLKPGRSLDVGCVARINPVPFTLARLGWEAWAIDLRNWNIKGLGVNFIIGDITNTGFPKEYYDLITFTSTLEHIGLKGRYGIKEKDAYGDIRAIREARRLLKPEGRILVTVPYSNEFRITRLNRTYDKIGLERHFGPITSIEVISRQNKEGIAFLELGK